MPNSPHITCVTCTCGREPVVHEAVSCWIDQSYPLARRELLVFNTAGVPIGLPDDPKFGGVRLVNQPGEYASLGAVRNAAMEHVGPDTDFISTWDDDDLYLPWHLEIGAKALVESGAKAWKPKQSWLCEGYRVFRPSENSFEASWLVAAELVRKHGYKAGGAGGAGCGDEHVPLMTAAWQQCCLQDTHPFLSYVYTWSTAVYHMSGRMGHKDNFQTWLRENCRFPTELRYVDVRPRWRRLLVNMREQWGRDDYLTLAQRLGFEVD